MWQRIAGWALVIDFIVTILGIILDAPILFIRISASLMVVIIYLFVGFFGYRYPYQTKFLRENRAIAAILVILGFTILIYTSAWLANL